MIAFMTPGPTELLLILFIALLIFGNRLPSVMRSLGSSMNEFKKGLNDIEAPVAAAAPVPVQAAPLAAPPVQPAPELAPAASKQLP